tara:strand:+ start:26 stop:682 length:657 start_codon:yes stop_codon:yes gene_type:complete
MECIVNSEPTIDDLMFVLNKCIKFKDSNNRQNVRKKLKKNDKQDILTQLAYVVHTNIMNKSVIEIKSEDSLETKRENFNLIKKIDTLEKTIIELKDGEKILKISNNSLREICNTTNGNDNNDIEDYKIEIESLKQKLESKRDSIKTVDNEFEKMQLEDLKKINKKLNQRIINGDFDNPSDKDITIRKLKEELNEMKIRNKMEQSLNEDYILNNLNNLN